MGEVNRRNPSFPAVSITQVGKAPGDVHLEAVERFSGGSPVDEVGKREEEREKKTAGD